jgi:hypothetical protein
MNEKLTWEEIEEKYPNQWVGLTDVEFEDNGNTTILSAVVTYVNYDKNDLLRMMLDSKCIMRYTTPDDTFQIGVIG